MESPYLCIFTEHNFKLEKIRVKIMLYIELCEVELELLADRHVNIGTIWEKRIP
jgi:hypothetical protein